MTTVTLPIPSGTLPRPGRYAVAAGRSIVELTAWYGPLPTRRRRLRLTEASLTVPDGPPDEPEHPSLSFDFAGLDRDDDTSAVLTSGELELLDGGRRLQVIGDLHVRGVRFLVLLRPPTA